MANVGINSWFSPKSGKVGRLTWNGGAQGGWAAAVPSWCPGRYQQLLLQVTVLLGASQDLIPQLKQQYDVDTLDMVFLDHWKERYLPDTLLLEVSSVRVTLLAAATGTRETQACQLATALELLQGTVAEVLPEVGAGRDERKGPGWRGAR